MVSAELARISQVANECSNAVTKFGPICAGNISSGVEKTDDLKPWLRRNFVTAFCVVSTTRTTTL